MAVPLLISVVDDDDPQVRAVAVEGLTAFRDPQITPVLAAALGDPSATVRLAALRGLGSRGQQLPQIAALTSEIARLLEDLNLEVGLQAAIALGRLQALGPLDRLLDRPLIPLALKIQVLRSLAWCETPAALEILQRRLQASLQGGPEDPDCHGISLALIQILGRIERSDLQGTATDSLLAALSLGQHRCWSPDQAAACALSLGQLAHSQAFEPLVQLLARPLAPVRFQVIAALKRIDPDHGRQRLEAMRLEAIATPTAPDTPPLTEGTADGIAFALTEWPA
ncbi:MAG: HEAT repeat domain-containing protein [Synechococcales cyanobacterium CRU_2_2]|nr:HEAT repeat domain-containing protein [Synechococcales cyanobacterium CRU_2_2]